MFTFVGRGVAVLCVLYGLVSLGWILTGQYGVTFDALREQGVTGVAAARAVREFGFYEDIGKALGAIGFGLGLGVMCEISLHLAGIRKSQ